MVDDLDQGRRPLFADGLETADLLPACPGAGLSGDGALGSQDFLPWGPVLRVWEGAAKDEEIRAAGSSGGAASALALWAIEAGGCGGVLHTRARVDEPVLNETVLSKNRDQIMAASGSRYAPASPGDGLHLVAGLEAPAVFIGKPCDVAGVHMAAAVKPEITDQIGLTIAIFCAGAPATRATLDYCRHLAGLQPSEVMSVRYRGQGWPGQFRVEGHSGQDAASSYEESWGVLQAGRPWRCRICPDHSGEFADISVGDPWHRPPDGVDVGRSLVVARTARGLQAVEAAMDAGYLQLEVVSADLIDRSQSGLRAVRARVFGRLLAMRILGVPVPTFRGLGLRSQWQTEVPFFLRVREVLSTMRRVLRYRLRSRREVAPVHEVSR